MTEQYAWVTLATNDAYSLGALVLAHSLQKVSSKYPVVILVTPSVTSVMRERLSTIFSRVVTVDVLDSKDAAHLALLSRPELGITFTKLHCWNLTDYKKCVFLDADTLVFQNCDELFDREELSAAPDVGWPDCFNSGVFVFTPSGETFDALIKLAQEKGSFDGGDQGLLNQYFSGWAQGDINKHLPFLYNVCSTAFYSYLPALKQFGGNTKIMHFIGNVKPWLQKFNWSSRTVADDSYLQGPLQFWWDIFIEKVHPVLDASMARWECGASNEARYFAPQNDQSPFPWHHHPPPPVSDEPSSAAPPTADFYDPWESYTPAPVEAPTPPYSRCSIYTDSQITNITTTNTAVNTTTNNNNNTVDEGPSDYRNHIDPPPTYHQTPWYETYASEKPPEVWQEAEAHDSNCQRGGSPIQCGPGGSYCGTVCYNFDFEQCHRIVNDWQQYNCEPEVTNDELEYEDENDDVVDDDVKSLDYLTEAEAEKPFIEEVRPRHPYDNYYLNHTVVLDRHGCKRCSHEESPPDPSPSPTPSTDTEPDRQGGIAGALSQLSIGDSSSGSSVEEHLRRQGWEAGNIDYMGADSFTNIWAKISQTLSGPPAQGAVAQPQPEPTEAPVVSVPPSDVASSTEESMTTAVSGPSAEMSVPSSITESTDSWESVPASVPVSQSSTDSPPLVLSADASQTSVDTSTTTADEASQEQPAATEENRDNKQGTAEEKTDVLIARPAEKLVCHLRPAAEVEALLTPENEHEDAASIAQSIIAGESLSTPTVTSPTAPPSHPVCPAVPQNLRDLCIDTTILETPPIPGPVSLAQIGILPSKTTDVTPRDVPTQHTENTDKVIEMPAIAPSEELKEVVEKIKEPVLKIDQPKIESTETETCTIKTKRIDKCSSPTSTPTDVPSKSPETITTESVVAPAEPRKSQVADAHIVNQPIESEPSSVPVVESAPKGKKDKGSQQPIAPKETAERKPPVPTEEKTPSSPSAEKKDPPSEPAAKPKRIIKKAAAPKAKVDAAEGTEKKSDPQPVKTEDVPVPPPRKKEKKPKEAALKK